MPPLNKTFTIFILVLIALAVTACGGAGDAAPTETPTPTMEEIGSGTGSGASSTDEPMEATQPAEPEDPAPTSETLDDLTPTPGGDYDSCLIGTWGIDKEAFADYLYQSLNRNEAVEFTFSEIEGDFEMVIEPGVLTYTSTEPLVLKLSMGANGITLTTLDMIITGQGSANWVTYENYFIQYGQGYNFFGNGLADTINSDLIGKAEVGVLLTPSMFISMAKFQNPDIPIFLEMYPDIKNFAAATYTCEGDTFTYQFDEYVAVWHRK